MADVQRDDDTILHQDTVEDVVEAVMAEGQDASIVDLSSPSGSYVQAEALATRNAVNGILAILREKGFIAPPT